ncbi:hypothetical protein BUE80_DR002509, partial [Diplocarpon rosae]
MKLSLVAFMALQASAVYAFTAKCGAPATLSSDYICAKKPYCCGDYYTSYGTGCSKPFDQNSEPADVRSEECGNG